MKMNGAQLLVELLERQGVSVVAGIPGGSVLPLYDSLARSSIKHILVRHEQAAGFLAQGISRSSDNVGVCIATSGPGAMNLLTAIADAHADSIPLIAITGQVNSKLIGTDAFQEVDTFGLSFPITKHSVMIKKPEELLTVIPRSFKLAMSGRPGPVLIDIPRDVQTAEIFFDAFPDQGKKIDGPELSFVPQLEKDKAVSEIATYIYDSSRPVFFAGGGCHNPQTEKALDVFLKKCPMPVVTSLMGLGVLPSDSPLNLGMVGMHGELAANRAMYDADLILACGVRFDDRATGIVTKFCPKAKIVHIDIDAAELNKIFRSEVSLVSDTESAILGIAANLSDGMRLSLNSENRKKWTENLRCILNTSRVALKKQKGSPCEFISSIPKALKKANVKPDSVFVTTDVGQHQMWTAQYYPLNHSRQFITSGSLGTMGFGLPTAIGASLANPKNRIICFSGDGSIMMNIQELATLAEQNLNVTVIVLDNGALGMVRQQQEFLYNSNYSASIFSRAPDVLKVAQGFGIKTIEAGSDDWEKNAFEGAGPRFVRCFIDQSENVFPFVPAGKPNIEPILE